MRNAAGIVDFLSSISEKVLINTERRKAAIVMKTIHFRRAFSALRPFFLRCLSESLSLLTLIAVLFSKQKTSGQYTCKSYGIGPVRFPTALLICRLISGFPLKPRPQRRRLRYRIATQSVLQSTHIKQSRRFPQQYCLFLSSFADPVSYSNCSQHPGLGRRRMDLYSPVPTQG